MVWEHRSIGLIRTSEITNRPKRSAKRSDCSCPTFERFTLGNRPERTPAALAKEWACLIKTIFGTLKGYRSNYTAALLGLRHGN
jgi:hypothetical protein